MRTFIKEGLPFFIHIANFLIVNLINMVFMRLTKNRVKPLVAILTG